MRSRTPSPARRRSLVAGLALFMIVAGGMRCGPLKIVDLASPDEDQLLPAATAVAVSGRVGQVFDPTTVALEIDGVDLVAALGLVAPFTDAAGVVLVGADLVSVTGFTYDPTLPGEPRISAQLAGLAPGVHALSLSALETQGGALGTDVHEFRLVDGFALELSQAAAVGLPDGPVETGTSGFLVNQSLGQAVAGPPVDMSGGGTLRTGHIPAAEGRITAGGN